MAEDSKYNYDRFGSKAQRVGQAVTDILSKKQDSITTGEIIESYGDEFRKELENTIEANSDKLDSPFYILVFTHKEHWANNVVRNWFIARQTPPFASHVVEQYPNRMKTLYMIDAKKGNIKICWSLPGVGDMISIMKSPLTFDPQLVKWITDFRDGHLDKEKYEFEYDWRD